MPAKIKFWCLLAAALAIAGCTVHPQGETEERTAATQAGQPYTHPIETRELPALAPDAPAEALATYALLTNGEVEARYWEWRAALEQVPQEGTQKTGLMLSLSTMITNGNMAWDTTTLGVGNDAMNSLVLPSKLRTSATVALEQAKAAGLRFDKARLELRAKVLTAYDEYALTAELARLDQANADMLELSQRLLASRLATGGATQQELLKATNESAMARNDLQTQQAAFPRYVAALNTLLNRAPDTPITPPASLPAIRPLTIKDSDLLAVAARNNPELLAQSRDLAARQHAVKRAKQEYQPEFNVGVSTDLEGMAQTLAGSVLIPAVRFEAINAAIEQAGANVRAAEAMQRQTGHDVAGQIVADLAMLRDTERQSDFFETTLLPQLRRIVAATQSEFATGHSTLPELVEAQRSEIAVRRLLVQLRAIHAEKIVDLEALSATYLP